jgi:hypothetical protein
MFALKRQKLFSSLRFGSTQHSGGHAFDNAQLCGSAQLAAGHGFTGCGKSRVSYQGMPSGILQVAQNQSRLQALAHEFILFPQPLQPCRSDPHNPWALSLAALHRVSRVSLDAVNRHPSM